MPILEMIPFRLSFRLFAETLQKDTNLEHIAILGVSHKQKHEYIVKTKTAWEFETAIAIETMQELRILSIVTLNCQARMIVMI